MTSHLPSAILWAQPEEDFAGGFNVDGQSGGMLHGRVDITKVPLQLILAVDAVGACGMEQAVNHPHCCVHAVRNGEPCLGNLTARIGYASAHGLPGCLDGCDNIGPSGAEDSFGFGYLRLDQGAVP